MTPSGHTSSGWVRIGARPEAVLVLFALAVSAGLSFVLFRDPVTRVVELVSGVPQNSFHTAVWVTGILFLIFAVLILFRTSRPLIVDLDRRVMKVGWRTVSIDQVSSAYRLPGGSSAGARHDWILQLEVPGSFDARLPMRTAAAPDLTSRELETLLSVLDSAPIEPKEGELVHAPVDGELGERAIPQQVADRVSEAIMPYTRVTFAKSTLIREVQKRLEGAREQEKFDGSPPEGGWGIRRVIAAILKGINQGSGDRGATRIFPPEPVIERDPVSLKRIPYSQRYLNNPLARGMLGTCLPSFIRERKAVEEWLRAESMTALPRSLSLRIVGWAVILLAIPMPWLFGSVVTVMMWPLILWMGLLMCYRARVARYLAVREGALGVLITGKSVPLFVQNFFAPRFPERTCGKHGYALGIIVTVVLIFPILLFVLTGSFSMMAGWSTVEQSWEKHYFAVVIALGVLSIALTVRWHYAVIRALARAKSEWQLLGGGT